MKTETTQLAPRAGKGTETTTPSAEFVTAISEFFQTDPSDLLVELGYYHRPAESQSALESPVKA